MEYKQKSHTAFSHLDASSCPLLYCQADSFDVDACASFISLHLKRGCIWNKLPATMVGRRKVFCWIATLDNHRWRYTQNIVVKNYKKTLFTLKPSDFACRIVCFSNCVLLLPKPTKLWLKTFFFKFWKYPVNKVSRKKVLCKIHSCSTICFATRLCPCILCCNLLKAFLQIAYSFQEFYKVELTNVYLWRKISKHAQQSQLYRNVCSQH